LLKCVLFVQKQKLDLVDINVGILTKYVLEFSKNELQWTDRECDKEKNLFFVRLFALIKARKCVGRSKWLRHGLDERLGCGQKISHGNSVSQNESFDGRERGNHR